MALARPRRRGAGRPRRPAGRPPPLPLAPPVAALLLLLGAAALLGAQQPARAYLLVAQPKAASTSLLLTLKRECSLRGGQSYNDGLAHTASDAGALEADDAAYAPALERCVDTARKRAQTRQQESAKAGLSHAESHALKETCAHSRAADMSATREGQSPHTAGCLRPPRRAAPFRCAPPRARR